MDLSPTAYGVLAGSVLAAILVDFALVRLALEFLRPPSMYVFLVGRLGKVLSMGAWLYFLNSFWYPEYVKQELPGMVVPAEGAIVLGLLILAFATLPRAPRGEARP